MLILLFIILVGCEENEPAITKIEEPPAEESTIEEVPEVTFTEEDKILEFLINDSVISIDANKIGILNAYLNTVKNTSIAIENMELNQISLNDQNEIYVLEFSCFENKCSYLLLNQEVNHESYLLDDLTKLNSFIVSPDGVYTLFTLQNSKETYFKIFNNQTWSTVPFTQSFFLQPSTIISSSKWLDNETAQLNVQYTNDEELQALEMEKELLINLTNEE